MSGPIFVNYLSLSIFLRQDALTGCCAGLFSPFDGISELWSFGPEVISTQHWHNVLNLFPMLPHFQVRASATPAPAVMEGRATTTETPSCVAAPQAGAAAPATQVRLTLITLLWL